MKKFSGIIEFKSDYHALKDFDNIINLMYNFKNKFDTTIQEINIDKESKHNWIIKITLNGCKFVFNNYSIEIEVYEDIETFNAVYNYILPLTNYDDIKEGDIVYNHNMKMIVQSIEDDRSFNVVYADDEDKEIKTAYKCWCVKFN